MVKSMILLIFVKALLNRVKEQLAKVFLIFILTNFQQLEVRATLIFILKGQKDSLLIINFFICNILKKFSIRLLEN